MTTNTNNPPVVTNRARFEKEILARYSVSSFQRAYGGGYVGYAAHRGMPSTYSDVQMLWEIWGAARSTTAHPPTRRSNDQPIGYLPAYELGRLHSGHDAQLRSAKFGPSALDGDVPVYLEVAAKAEPPAVADNPVAPTLWFRPLVGAEAKPNGQCYDVVFVDPKDERYQPLYAAAPKAVQQHADVLEAHTNGYELGMRQQDRATKPAPAAQGDALGSHDVREPTAIGCAVNRAARDLPEGWEIRIDLERGAGVVLLTDHEGNETMIDGGGELFSDQINAAIDAARAAKEGDQHG